MQADSHAFQERGHRPLRVLGVSELRSEVGDLLPRCLEIGIGYGPRLGECQDLGLQSLDELVACIGPVLERLDLLGVQGPLSLYLSLKLALEPGPLGLDGLEMIGIELIVQIEQFVQSSLQNSTFRASRVKLFAGQEVLLVQPASFIAMCLLSAGKGVVKFVELPLQLFAFLLQFLLATGQSAREAHQPRPRRPAAGRRAVPTQRVSWQAHRRRWRTCSASSSLRTCEDSRTCAFSASRLSSWSALNLNAFQSVIELLDLPAERFDLQPGQA